MTEPKFVSPSAVTKERLSGATMKDQIARAELALLQTAVYYDLASREERKRSNADLVALYYELVSALSPSLFVEAGARDAFASRKVRDLLPNARVVAFEANPHNHSRFAEKFSFEKRGIEYLHLALSHVAGPVSFNVQTHAPGKNPSPHTGRSSLLNRPEDGVVFEEVQVDAVTLDEFFPSSDSAAMWVDVEGANGLVLPGGRRFLEGTNLLMIEIEDVPIFDEGWLLPQVAAYLDARGLIAIARDFEFHRQHNVIYVRAAAMESINVRRAISAYYSRIASTRNKRDP